MKKTMKIHMCGPMQAYGKKPEGNYIATHHQPTKSAIVGLLGCSGGIPRNDPRLKEIYDSIEISVESYHTPKRGEPLVPMVASREVAPNEHLVSYKKVVCRV